MKVLTLYHFTCEHGHNGISKTGVLRPNTHPYMPYLGPLLWLSDLAEPPSKESLGLTSRLSTCDRLAYRYIVHSKAAIHWFEVRDRVHEDVAEALESYGQPEHWWIARRELLPSEFTFDAAWRRKVSI